MEKRAPDYAARCQRVQRSMEDEGIDILLIGPSADLLYLIGLNRPQSERLTLLIIPRDGPIRLVLPSFERALAEPLAAFFELATWEETEDPAKLFATLLPNRGEGLKLGVANKLFVHFLFGLQREVPGASFVPAGPLLDQMRMKKEDFEIEQLAAAGAAADRVFSALLQEELVGMSEASLKSRIISLLTDYGHDVAGGAIVGAGSNGASPHHHIGLRQLKKGDAVVIDFGGTVGGYWSDMTRTIHIDTPSSEFQEVYDIVRQANQKAFEAVRPGVTAETIDKTARSVIAAGGYGEYFLHRTGHGIGLEIHEPPYIVGGSDQVLEAGMTFSIEPGIYLAGKFGVRIEDIVVVTEHGGRRLNQSSHDLLAI